MRKSHEGQASPYPRQPISKSTVVTEGREKWKSPWVQLKYFSFHPCLYPAMLLAHSSDATPGALVHVYDRQGQLFGTGLFNPKARVPLRVFHHGMEPVGEDALDTLVERAVDFRINHLRLRETTEAFRVIHSDGDGLSGLVVDCFGDVLSIEIHSLGMSQRLPRWLPRLRECLQARKAVIHVDPRIAHIEGIRLGDLPSDPLRGVKFRENGIGYEVDFASGHKTGFFCDQRENRRRVGQLNQDRRMLDLCCYTGGFALAAHSLGRAKDVTGVDLDETAIAQARRNANLNQARIQWVHCDAFTYARQMIRNGERWDMVVVDPPKLVLNREDVREGEQKYEDLNGLAIQLVTPGGLYVTCSCSGLLSPASFEQIVCRAAHRVGRRLHIFDRTGAGPDHPVMSNCPESLYLKVLWARVN